VSTQSVSDVTLMFEVEMMRYQQELDYRLHDVDALRLKERRSYDAMS
jgi:hypothetical protein